MAKRILYDPNIAKGLYVTSLQSGWVITGNTAALDDQLGRDGPIIPAAAPAPPSGTLIARTLMGVGIELLLAFTAFTAALRT